MEGDDDEDPECGEMNQFMAERVTSLLADLVDDEQSIHPEDANGGPTCEAMGILEGIVREESIPRIRQRNNAKQHHKQNASQSKDRYRPQHEIGKLDGQHDRKQKEPQGARHRAARMHATVFVHLGEHAPDAERRRMWNQPADAVQEIDDIVLSYQDRHAEVDRGGSRQIGKVQIVDACVAQARKPYNQGDDVAHEDDREEPSVHVEVCVSDVAHDSVLTLVGNLEVKGIDTAHRIDSVCAVVAHVSGSPWAALFVQQTLLDVTGGQQALLDIAGRFERGLGRVADRGRRP